MYRTVFFASVLFALSISACNRSTTQPISSTSDWRLASPTPEQLPAEKLDALNAVSIIPHGDPCDEFQAELATRILARQALFYHEAVRQVTKRDPDQLLAFYHQVAYLAAWRYVDGIRELKAAHKANRDATILICDELPIWEAIESRPPTLGGDVGQMLEAIEGMRRRTGGFRSATKSRGEVPSKEELDN